MLKNYRNELVAIATAFGLISYTVYVCAAEPVKAKPAVEVKKEVAKPVDKKAAKPAKEVKPAEPVKKEHAKKPTLKAKYANKK